MAGNQLHEVIVSMTNMQDQIGLAIEAMTAIRNISEGRLGWHWKTPDERLAAINALSDLMHNFAPGDPVRLAVVRSQFEMHCNRALEAFELCPMLVSWAQQNADKA